MRHVLIFIFIFVFAFHSVVVAAEKGEQKTTRGALFQSDSPKNIFTRKVADSNEYGIIMVRPWDEPEKPLPPEAKPKKEKTQPEQLDIPGSRDEILARFGSPSEPEPLKADEDAPRPFQGMMAALNIGDEQLAYEYSKKWVHYLDRLDKATDDVTGFTGKVLEKEGKLDPEEGWAAKSSKFDKYNKYIDNDIKDEIANGRSRIDNLTTYLPKRIRAQVVSKESFESEGADLLFNEAQARADIRKALSNKVPITKKSRLDIYFFFDPKRASSMAMAREIEQLHQKNLTEHSFNLVGVALGNASDDLMKAFRKESGITYPVIGGDTALPKIFEVKKNPTVLFHLPQNELAFYEEGLRRGFYLDEVRKLIQRSSML